MEGGGGSSQTGRIPVLQNFGLKLTLYLIKWNIKNCNIRKDIWKVYFKKKNKFVSVYLAYLTVVAVPKHY